MTRPAAYQAAGEPIRTVSVSESHSPRTPRSQVRDAIRVCLDLGYCVSGGHAWQLIRDWHATRDADAHNFIASEFGAYVQRRGDLMTIRSKPKHEWRTHT